MPTDDANGRRGPNALRDEVVRQRLIDRLAERWHVTVTLLEAAGGFGKSVALAQAMRDNDSDPSGIDVYVVCRRTDTGSRHLAMRLLTAVDAAAAGAGGRTPGMAAIDAVAPVAQATDAVDGGAGPAGDAVGQLADLVSTALARLSPTRVALILDDVHHLSGDRSSTDLLAAVLKRLPANATLVLAGRQVPQLPMARLQAADQVLAIDGSELAFTVAEVAELASFHRVDPLSLGPTRGWPALTRLAITVGRVASIEYLIEEVVETFDAQTRRAVAVTVIAKRIDPVALVRLSGIESVRRFVAEVPLISADERSWISAHDFWGEALDAFTTHDERAAIAAEVAVWMAGTGRFAAAIEVAAGYGAWRAALDALVGFVGGGAAFPTAVRAADWLRRIPDEWSGEPELALLRGLVERLRGAPGGGAADADRALAAFEARGDVAAIAAAGFEVGFGAWSRGDLAKVFEVYQLALRLHAEGHEHLAPMVHLVQAVIADLEGNRSSARQHLDEVDTDRIPESVVTYLLRMHISLSAVLGDTERSVQMGDRLLALDPSPYAEFTSVLAHWYHDDPRPAAACWADMRTWSVDSSHENHNLAAFCTLIDASFGNATRRHALDEFEAPRSRERAIGTIALIARGIVEGDELAAAEAMEDLERAARAGDAFIAGELRRMPAIPYVLSAQSRARFDAADDLGPRQLKHRQVARALVDARLGGDVDWAGLPGVDAVFCALPLPWSVELTCIAAKQGADIWPSLADRLVELGGQRTMDLVVGLAGRGGDAGAGASRVLEWLPTAPTSFTRVTAFGPMHVATETPTDGSLVRRSRVRSLLGLLLLRERVAIDTATDALWPELSSAQARNNLRITLTFLRKLLEPDRVPGSESFHVCRNSGHLWLRRSPQLDSDVWSVRRALAAGAEHERRGDLDAAVGEYSTAVDAWTGELLPDLRDNHVAAPDIIGLELRLADRAALVAEWSLAHRDHRRASSTAERLLDHDPYHERAYAVLISAHLTAGDLDAAERAADRCRHALDELRVPPANVTAIVLRRVERARAEAL